MGSEAERRQAQRVAKRVFQWTADLEEVVLDEHSSGRTFLDVCGETAPVDEAGTKLTYQIVYAHERESPGFRDRMKIAQDQYCRTLFDECIQIADDSSGDWRQRLTRGGETIAEVDGEAIARSKVRIDTRLKALAKIDPTRYGDPKKGPAVAVGIGVGVQVNGGGVLGVDPKTVSPLDAARRVAFLLAKGKQATTGAGQQPGRAPVTIDQPTVELVVRQPTPHPSIAPIDDDDVL